MFHSSMFAVVLLFLLVETNRSRKYVCRLEESEKWRKIHSPKGKKEGGFLEPIPKKFLKKDEKHSSTEIRFTLLEILLVVALLTTLAEFLFPFLLFLQKVHLKPQRRVRCKAFENTKFLPVLQYMI